MSAATRPPRPRRAALPGVLLAAGASRRMGCCKLTLPLNGVPLVAHALAAARAVLEPVVVVLGPEASSELFRAVTPRLRANEEPLQPVSASRAPLGQAESLKAGLARVLELDPEAPGVMVLLGDQPLVSADLVRVLADSFLTGGEAACVAPVCGERRGNPVVLHRDLFSAVLRLEGDVGARELLANFPLRLVPWNDTCLADADTPELYARLVQRCS